MESEKIFLQKEINFSDILKFGILLIFLILLFIFYTDFVTFKESLTGEKILYVKIDGNNGSVLKVNNKYLKKQAVIKNSKNLSYGFYWIKYKIKNVKEKNGFITIEGKISGYKESKLNGVRRYVLNIIK